MGSPDGTLTWNNKNVVCNNNLLGNVVLNITKRIKLGYKENKCECCGITEWNGNPYGLSSVGIMGICCSMGRIGI